MVQRSGLSTHQCWLKTHAFKELQHQDTSISKSADNENKYLTS